MSGVESVDKALGQAVEDIGGYIRKQRESAQVSLRQLAKVAGISNPYLSQIERGLRKPSAEILQQIARALEISSETLYVRAGILDPRDSNADLVTEIRRDPHINEDQKKTLVRIYESFRHENGSPTGADEEVADAHR
jgi:transcriptional regulator with XRE-family HTH domain